MVIRVLGLIGIRSRVMSPSKPLRLAEMISKKFSWAGKEENGKCHI
jgi:hypothetical protein